jgi:glycosyltransferase involved in cell wall biosynthesis
MEKCGKNHLEWLSGSLRMKIAIVTDCVDDHAAGVGVYTKNLVENLLKVDNNNKYVLVHYRSGKDQFYSGKNELVIPMRRWPFYREFRKIFLMPKILESQGFDIVHDPMQIGPFFFRKKYKAVVTIHDLAPLLFPKTFNWAVPFHHRFGLRMTLPNVDLILADSDNTKNDIKSRFPLQADKARVVYLGVTEHFARANKAQVSSFKKKYNLARPFILFLGTLEPRKNIETLINAFAKLKNEKGIHEVLVIAGARGWKFSKIFASVKDLGLQEDVVFLGYVEDMLMPALYSSAEIFVFPSIYEGFGLPPLEAMKCGCPVVCSNAASLQEVVGDAALAVDPYDIAALADSIFKVLRDAGFRKKLVEKGYRNVSRFSWAKCAKDTLTLYEGL